MPSATFLRVRRDLRLPSASYGDSQNLVTDANDAAPERELTATN